MSTRKAAVHVRQKHEAAEGRNPGKAFKADEEMMSEMRQAVTRCEMMIALNHRAIERVGELLNQSQPPMAGKIEVRWWRAASKGPRPVVTIWDDEKGSPVILPPVRLKRKASRRAAFQRNYAETQMLLALLEELMEKRAALLRYNGDYKRLVMKFFNSNHRVLVKLHAQHFFDDMEKKIVRNNAVATEFK